MEPGGDLGLMPGIRRLRPHLREMRMRVHMRVREKSL